MTSKKRSSCDFAHVRRHFLLIKVRWRHFARIFRELSRFSGILQRFSRILPGFSPN